MSGGGVAHRNLRRGTSFMNKTFTAFEGKSVPCVVFDSKLYDNQKSIGFIATQQAVLQSETQPHSQTAEKRTESRN